MLKVILYFAFSTLIAFSSAFDNQCNDNLVDYWGQNSYGAANGNDPSGWQQPLRFYCEDDAVDVLPIAFLTTFFGVGGEPQINLANYCNSADNATFPGSNLANCQNISPDIKYCQSKGKLITLSLGGATGGVGFQSDAQASAFADTLWNLFFGGNSNTRPFGDAVLDGVDLDIEGGGPNHYVTFLKKLDSYFSASDKKYYVTAAPQCVYPDANLQLTLNNYPFDAVYVQFYNNPCGLQNFNSPNQWNFGIWDIWARTISPNPNVKVLIGAPASTSAAGGGYVPADTLIDIARKTRDRFPSFGGVMLWDASQAYKNGRIDAAVKNALQSGKRCDGGFDYPLCTAPAWASGKGYSAGDTVTYKYMWTAKWYASNAPSADVNSDWSPVSSCKGGAGDTGNTPPSSTRTVTISASSTTSSISSSSQTSTTTTSSSKTSTTTSSSSSKTSSGTITATLTTKTTLTSTVTKTSITTITGNTSTNAATTIPTDSCSGVPAWSSSTSYVSASKVTYQGNIWQAQWWSYNDVPGGTSGVWTKLGSCLTKRLRKRRRISV
ncbi:Chitinase 1 [Rhizopus stolonifer]|uniref:chitinase n=1 Tax=Rhizopus stolonifer TaxID=4846 RepID=A0A367KIZ0_RHIST|nr:Chitinase 1 [Rhizopus stolonifer]